MLEVRLACNHASDSPDDSLPLVDVRPGMLAKLLHKPSKLLEVGSNVIVDLGEGLGLDGFGRDVVETSGPDGLAKNDCDLCAL